MARSLILLILGTLATIGAGCSGPVTSEDWRQDLRSLEQQLAERHVDLYHTVSNEAFKAAADTLYDRIPTLTTPEILVGFAQLVALVGDGHTSFYPSNQDVNWFRFFPISLFAFSDGIYLTTATEEHAHLFGKRLVQIDDTSIEDAFDAISTTIGADNPMEYQYTVPFEMVRPELLHVLGVAASPDSARFVFEDGTVETFRPVTEKALHDLDRLVVNPIYGPERRSPSLRFEFLFASALTLPHLQEREYYWYTYLEDHRALFFQYNACWDQKDRPMFAAVAEEMLAFADEHGAERLIIDLRQNTGGEPMIAEPLIEELARRAERGARGGVFVLVGRRTFSAALTNAAQLRSRAGARIVGEPPRGKPNSPSEGRDIDLEATGIWLTVSTQFVERDPALGDANYLPVDIPITVSFDEYSRGLDPVLEAALNETLMPDAGF